MLRSKAFVKKTRKGGVVKVVREHYLRDDVTCGSAACTQCEFEEGAEQPLVAVPTSVSKVCPEPHYLLPDTNIVLHQVDVLEQGVFSNLVLLQTVLGEAKNRNNATHDRLRAMAADKEKHCYVFTNEHHRETYAERQPEETANDYNDRAIRTAASWYNRHLSAADPPVKVVLLTNDRACREKAKDENITAFTLEEYVEGIEGQPELHDLVAQRAEGEAVEGDEQESVNYPEYLAQSKLLAGIKAGKYHQGTFNRSRENYLEGQVLVAAYPTPVLCKGRLACNRVIDGDVVVVELLPEEQWEHPSKKLLIDEVDTQEAEEEAEGSEKAAAKPAKVPPPPNGRVVGVIKRNWRSYCGILLPARSKGTVRMFKAADRSVPHIKIRTRQGDALDGQRLIVRIDGWERRSRHPHGHYVRTIGRLGDKEAENEVLLIEHDVAHHSFGPAVLACLPQMPWGLTAEDLQRRKDLRGLNICSIDPPGCTDIDDALHMRPLPNGNMEVGVHIADVTHFVKPGTALDAEAAARGTTVYLTDQRIDMLPELLGTNLCSLRSNVDRLAFSVLWELDQEGNMVDVMFAKTIIRSKASFTYEEAQTRIGDPNMTDDLTESIRSLNRLAKIFKQRRMDAGALTLASPEVRFQLAEDEQHDPLDVAIKQLHETNSLVEEFMLLANTTVATKIYEHFPDSAMLRRHPSPPQEKFDDLVRWAKSVGVDLDTSSSKALADSLDDAVVEGSPFFNTLIRILATRCMMQAVYFSSGLLPYDEFRHYGLATPIYTHFTSPIRRYADDIVHRMLAAAIGWEDPDSSLMDKNGMGELAANLNHRHRMAQFAGRASVELYTHLFFKNRVVDEDAYLIRIRDNALVALVPKYGIEGSIFLSEAGQVGKVAYNEDEQTIVMQGEGTEHRFRMFDRVTVQISVDDHDPQHQRLRMQLVKPEVLGLSVAPVGRSQAEPASEPPAKKRKCTA